MTFIIAEVGSNFQSSDDCLKSIEAAKECGADAVKFQMYTHKELYGYDEDISLPVNQTRYPAKLPGELPREWIPQLAKACEHYGIEFMCTAFSPEGYRFIDPFVKRHKIASAETSDLDILKCLRELGKPVLFSTGGSTFDEMKEVFFALCDGVNLKPIDVTPMYCVSAYPAKNIYVGLVQTLRMCFGVPVGYSCHTSDWVTSVYAALAFGASTIEKHFKIRDMETPDDPHSILPADFKRMVHSIRNGLEPDLPHPDEADFVKYAKRRWIPELGGYYRTKNPHE